MRVLRTFLLLFCAIPVGAQIAQVGGAAGTATSGTTLGITYSSTGGNMMVVTYNTKTTITASINNITDSSGGTITWTKAVGITNGSSGREEIWTSNLSAVAITSLTLNLAAAVTDGIAHVEEYSGVLAIGSHNSNTGTGTTLSVAITTQDANNFVVAGLGDNFLQTETAQNGTIRQQTAGAASQEALADNTAASATSVTVSTTTAASHTWQVAAVELRSVAATGNQGCAIDGLLTNGSIQSYAFCQPLVINGRNQGGWIALNRAGDLSNSESQCYSPDNIVIQGGFLTEIVRARTKTCHYWPNQAGSSSITQSFDSAFVQWNTFNFTFGDVQIRMKGPVNPPNGGWPSMWFLGANCIFSSKVTADNGTFNGKTCNWHSTGSEEIDLFEEHGSANGTTSSTCNAFLNGSTPTGSYSFSDSSQNFHIYELQWISGSLQWFLDGVHQTACDKSTNIPSNPMFLQMNVAMTSTATSTGLAATMIVDWVKVCQPSPCNGSGSNIIFFDDFVTPIAVNLLRPLSRMAKAAGTNIAPSTALIPGLLAEERKQTPKEFVK